MPVYFPDVFLGEVCLSKTISVFFYEFLYRYYVIFSIVLYGLEDFLKNPLQDPRMARTG